MQARLLEVRNWTYPTFVELGRAPSAQEVAGAADRTSAEVEAVWRDLHRAHALVLNPATNAMSASCFIAWFPPPTGGTTSSSPEAR